MDPPDSNTDVVIAIINTSGQLAKLRPELAQFIIQAMTSWAPSAIANETPMKVKSVEKAVYIFLNHMLRYVLSLPLYSSAVLTWTNRMCRTHAGLPHAGEITRALDGIVERIRHLVQLEQVRRVEAMAQSKRAAPDGLAGADVKRLKLDPDAADTLASFNWRTLGPDVVTNLIVANLQHFGESTVLGAIDVRCFLSTHYSLIRGC